LDISRHFRLPLVFLEAHRAGRARYVLKTIATCCVVRDVY
jgi:hypothetical protein